MKTYPARFIGEFDRVSYFTHEPNVGDVALIHRGGYPDGRDRIAIRCACGEVDVIPCDAQGWQLTSRDPVNVEPSILVRAGDVSRCHYFVHGGELQMLDDTTNPLRDV